MTWASLPRFGSVLASAVERWHVRPQRAAAILLLLVLAGGCATTKPATEPVLGAQHGIAGWYGQEFAGRTTANGEIFDPMMLTAAHRTLPFGTILDVKNPKNDKTVRVRINDRGPFVGNRIIDLSYAAADQLGLAQQGIGEVEINVVKLGGGDKEAPAPYVVSVAPPKAGEPPPVDFPLPKPAPAPVAAPPTAPPFVAAAPVVEPPASISPEPATADTVTNIQVTEQHGSDPAVPVRRQVSADGKRVEVVGATGEATPVPADRHSQAAALDRKSPSASPAPAGSPHTPKFAIQAGAFAQEANAQALQERLAAIGQKSYIVKTSLYHVRIGPFSTREQAISAREKLEAAGMSAIIVTE